MSNEDTVNQCQGCQAGWELVECTHKFVWLPRSGVREPRLNHAVQGGYEGELVACTRHLYNTEENNND